MDRIRTLLAAALLLQVLVGPVMAAWTNPTVRANADTITVSIWNTDLVNNLQFLHDNYEASTASLTALAGLTPSADTIGYYTGSTTAGVTSFTSFGRSLAGAANAAAAQSLIGVGAASVGDTQLDPAGTLIFKTGMVMSTFAASADAGWVMLSGRTIGDASSGATERANADTSALYTMLWTNTTNTECPVSSGRGGSAAADFAAHKTLTLPDARGRVIAGKDNMGGSTASRLTSGGSGITGTTLGTSGGAETHTLSTAEMPAHSHTINSATTGITINSTTATNAASFTGVTAALLATVTNVFNGGGATLSFYTNASSTAVSVSDPGHTHSQNPHTHSIADSGHTHTENNTGGGGAHTVTQPTLIANKEIKL